MPENDRIASSQGFPTENPDGTPTLVGPDDYTRQLRRDYADRERVDVLAGNLADLQRLGAQAATTGSASVASVVAAPAGVDPKSDQTLTPAQASAARGEWNRETEREGLLGPPPAPEPPEGTSAEPVDPTSQSPTVVGGKDNTKTSSTTPSPSSTPKKS